jgi:hypothetical protein
MSTFEDYPAGTVFRLKTNLYTVAKWAIKDYVFLTQEELDFVLTKAHSEGDLYTWDPECHTMSGPDELWMEPDEVVEGHKLFQVT